MDGQTLNWEISLAFALGLVACSPCVAQTAPQEHQRAKNECDAGHLSAAASSDGYGLYPPGRYCDGLVVEQHSAPSLQIVSFSMATEPLGAARTLVLRTPLVKGEGAQVLRGRNLSGAAAYRFDARVRDTRAFELNLDRVASKHNIDATTMAFVGEALIEGAPYLTPVAIGRTSGQTGWPAKYLLTLRLSSASASISYTLLPLSGGPSVANGTVDGPIAADELVSIPIDASKPGTFRLNLEIQGISGNGSAKSTAFTRRIYSGGAE